MWFIRFKNTLCGNKFCFNFKYNKPNRKKKNLNCDLRCSKNLFYFKLDFCFCFRFFLKPLLFVGVGVFNAKKKKKRKRLKIYSPEFLYLASHHLKLKGPIKIFF